MSSSQPQSFSFQTFFEVRPSLSRRDTLRRSERDWRAQVGPSWPKWKPARYTSARAELRPTFDPQSSKDAPLFSEKPLPPRTSANQNSMRAKMDDVSLEGHVGDLPLWRRLPAWVPIICWISTSSFVILQNKHILSGLGFSHPIALTTIHLLFQAVMTRILRQYTNLIDGAKELEATGKMTREVFIRKIVPIGILFSASLVLSNWVYVQRKSPIKEAPDTLPQIPGAVRQLHSNDQGLHPRDGALDLIRPEAQGAITKAICLCLCVNAIILLPVEGFQPFHDAIHLVGIPTLLGNACMTFALNLSSVWLIGKASGLVLTLAGVVKDILLITGSWAILGSTITPTQIFGYAIALSGLMMFKLSS
ncbi:hypothetical protein P7C70_g774, partial [Phenoliferia sp. Uapishka_3]